MHIKEAFQNKSSGLLNIYFTAGYPELDSLPVILPALEKAGVNMVEIGLPYSDPLSDGPTIQASSARAIANGITTELIFQQLEQTDSSIPLILMGYFNSVYQFGIEEFCKRCKSAGVTGLILPDLPIEIYLDKYQALFESYDLANIFLVTPETSDDRIRLIDENSKAFIYAVSSSSTTGKSKEISGAKSYLTRLKELNLQSPLMVGFNISNADDFEFVNQYASGGIIGSAFIRHIKDSKILAADAGSFVKGILRS